MSGVAAGHADHAATRRFPFTEKSIKIFYQQKLKRVQK